MIGAFLKNTPLPGEFCSVLKAWGLLLSKKLQNYFCPEWKPVR